MLYTNIMRIWDILTMAEFIALAICWNESSQRRAGPGVGCLEK